MKIVRGKEGLSSIKKDWLSITDNMNHRRFYHLYEWYRSYIDTIEEDDLSVYFCVSYKKSTPMAIFPLKVIRRNIFGVRFDTLEVPDHPNIDLSDFIVRNGEEICEEMGFLIEQLEGDADIVWDMISLPHVLEDSPAVRAFRSLSPRFVDLDCIGRSNYIPCDTPERIDERVSRNFKGNLRKARNKLKKLGSVELVSTLNGEELGRCFKAFLDVEASGWKGVEGTKTGIKLHPPIEAFYRGLVENYSEINGCMINLLKCQSEYIAGQFCLHVDDTVYILKIGYDERYSKVAPGNMLLEYVFEKLAKDKDTQKISLVTGSEWHSVWKPLSYKVFRILIFNNSAKGLLGLLLVKAKRRIKRFYNREEYGRVNSISR